MRALIIGGGIGGLTAALALRRAGFEASIYESAEVLQPVGKGIWVPTNAMRVLAALGVAGDVQSAGWALQAIELCTRYGGLLQRIDLDTIRATYGYTTISIHRSELQKALASQLPAEALHLGKRCTEFAEDGGQLVVRFADGTEAAGDVLIGADGIHSTIRATLFPSVALRDVGQTTYRGVAALELPPHLQRICREVWGGGARMGFSAIGPNEVYWFAPVTAPAGRPDPPGGVAGMLGQLYDNFPAPVPEIIACTPPQDILRTDLYDLVPLRCWHRGRVVLLGDAAHAMTPNLGQGGAQAIEDAFVLAQALAQSPDVEDGLHYYERQRRRRANWITRRARQYGTWAHLERRPAQQMRDFLMRHTPSRVPQRTLAFLYGSGPV